MLPWNFEQTMENGKKNNASDLLTSSGLNMALYGAVIRQD